MIISIKFEIFLIHISLFAILIFAYVQGVKALEYPKSYQHQEGFFGC